MVDGWSRVVDGGQWTAGGVRWTKTHRNRQNTQKMEPDRSQEGNQAQNAPAMQKKHQNAPKKTRRTKFATTQHKTRATCDSASHIWPGSAKSDGVAGERVWNRSKTCGNTPRSTCSGGMGSGQNGCGHDPARARARARAGRAAGRLTAAHGSMTGTGLHHRPPFGSSFDHDHPLAVHLGPHCHGALHEGTRDGPVALLTHRRAPTIAIAQPMLRPGKMRHRDVRAAILPEDLRDQHRQRHRPVTPALAKEIDDDPTILLLVRPC